MSTCVKIIFREEKGGVDVRVGYDETPDATETELNYAIAFAQQLSVLVQDMANAQNLKKKWRRDTGNATALREALGEGMKKGGAE